MGKSFYIYNNGRLERKDNTLRFITEDGKIKDIPIAQAEDLYVMNQTDFNVAMLQLLSQYQICVHFFGWYDNYIGSFYPKESILSGRMLTKQVEHYLDENKRLVIAKAFIEAAAANIYRNLRYYNSRGKNLEEQMKKIKIMKNDIKYTHNIKELMGVEGNIRQTYYSAWNTIIDQDLDFSKRVMHPTDNEINSLISFVNALIYSKLLNEIYKTQLNPTISYLHVPGVRRFSLCLDISEVFKPILADRLIFSLLNRKMITEKSFDDDLNGLHLKKEASRLITQELDKVLDKTIRHKDLDRDVSYRYLMRLECYKLMKHLNGEKEYQGFEIWW